MLEHICSFMLTKHANDDPKTTIKDEKKIILHISIPRIFRNNKRKVIHTFQNSRKDLATEKYK